jgi:hypothetical protein
MTSTLQHVKDRHVNTDLHTVWVDEVEHVATFPLWTLSGQLAGYQRYRPSAGKVQKNDTDGRYYTYRGCKLVHKHSQTVAVWGMESWYLSNTLFVFEGVFDAARVTELGYSAIATLSNDPNTDTRNWLYCVKQQRPVVAVCDPGKAGAKLASVGHMSHTVDIPNLPDGDLGDADDSYVRQLLREYT